MTEEEKEKPATPPDTELEQLKKQASERVEMEERLARALADYQNLRKRVEKDVQTRSEDMLTGMVRDLLIALDHLDMALKTSESSAGAEHKLREGVVLTRMEFDMLLSRQGIEPIQAQGAIFDPKLHEAVTQEFRDGVAPGTILEELRKGYRWRDRILRPSQVKVAAAPKDEAPKSTEA